MRTAFVFGLSPWKGFIRYWLPHEEIYRRGKRVSWIEFMFFWRPRILASSSPEVFVWGYRSPRFLEEFCSRHNIPLIRMEDGFIRSIALGATKTPPLSLCFDSPVLHYDPSAPSRLERIIQTYGFASDHALMQRARQGIDRLLQTKISKYNLSKYADVRTIYGPKNKKRILVIGQVEDDMSIIKGCQQLIDNNDLVRYAYEENPSAQIIYKPHPEVLHGTRRARSNPEKVKSIAQILDQDISLADAFETIDHVYTITSLSGFEALLRGIEVTCLGMPFYAGWGLTSDFQKCERRTAKRTVEELFAASYILYPVYFDPVLKKEISFEEALELLFLWRSADAIPSRA
jgi:capsular polysaccharide export protein